MSRRRAGLSPSLFPFLAVLVCTLGTLILLLALVAQEARDNAIAEAEQKRQTAHAPPPPPLAPSALGLTKAAANRLLEEEAFRVQELVSFRDAQTTDVEQRRDQLTAIEDHRRRLAEKLKRLDAEIDAAMSPKEALRLDARSLVMMRDEIVKLRAEIEKLEEEKRGAKPRVIIVPHRGPNGTQRRPIYVQCNADGVTIEPEGGEISRTQLIAAAESNSPSNNPLDAALRTVRRHAMRVYGDVVPPYPLLVVRPDGIHTYMAARAAMKDWDDQYGYELVPADVELAFPKPDNVLRKEIELAIHEASARQFRLGSFVGGTGGGNGGESAIRGARYQGSGYQGSGTRPVQMPSSMNESTIGDGQPQRNQFADDASADGMPTDQIALTDPSSTAGGSMKRSRSAPPKPLPTLSARSLDLQAQSNGFAPPRDRAMRNPRSLYQESVPGSGSNPFKAQGESASQSEALNRFLAGEFEDGSPSENSASNTSFGGRPGVSGETRMVGESANSNEAGEPTADGDQQSSNAADSSTSAANGTGGSAASPPPTNSMAAASGGPSQSQSSPPPPDSQPPSSAPPSIPLVQRQGRNWAMPRTMAGQVGTEVVRPIALRCQHDRYELIQRGEVVATFPFKQDGVYKATMKLATAVRDRVRSWGATLPGGRWQPQLDVQVGPHADQRYHELRTLMQGSGVEVIRRSQ